MLIEELHTAVMIFGAALGSIVTCTIFLNKKMPE